MVKHDRIEACYARDQVEVCVGGNDVSQSMIHRNGRVQQGRSGRYAHLLHRSSNDLLLHLIPICNGQLKREKPLQRFPPLIVQTLVLARVTAQESRVIPQRCGWPLLVEALHGDQPVARTAEELLGVKEKKD